MAGGGLRFSGVLLVSFSISEHQPALFQEDVCLEIRLAVTEQFAILFEQGNGSRVLLPGFVEAPELVWCHFCLVPLAILDGVVYVLPLLNGVLVCNICTFGFDRALLSPSLSLSDVSLLIRSKRSDTILVT